MNVLVLECIGFCFFMFWLKFEARCLNACRVFEKMPKCVWMNVLVLECIEFSFGYALFRVWMNVWLIWLNLVCLLIVGCWCKHQLCVGGTPTMLWHGMAKAMTLLVAHQRTFSGPPMMPCHGANRGLWPVGSSLMHANKPQRHQWATDGAKYT